MKNKFIITAPAVCLAVLFYLTIPAWATNHALLIGVGSYPHLPLKDQLDGPPHDVRALTDTLTTACDFAPENITCLVDKAATRTAILQAMGGMKSQTRPGDFIFIYFSGHGTSQHNNKAASLTMGAHTGALVPVDFSTDGSPEAMLERLIIGKRDLFPVIDDLEKDRHVLAVFDACYSGQAIRSPLPRGKFRYVALPVDALDDSEDDAPAAYGTDTIQRPPYPYVNTVYISAADAFEEAMDIDRKTIYQGFMTVDGLPHGAMTNALLRAMQGKAGADVDGDGYLTYAELYTNIRNAVNRDFAHTPCMLYPENRQDMTKRIAFRIPSPPPPENISTNIRTTLRVKLAGTARALKSEVAALSGIETVDGEYDVLVTPFAAKTNGTETIFRLYLQNQTLLATVPSGEVIQRLSRQVQVQKLTALDYPPAGFHVFTEAIGGSGLLLEGSFIGFRILNDADAWLLLINIGPTGAINVLYPAFENEMPMVPAGKGVNMPDVAKVVPPYFGTEYLKAFAFKKRPGDLKHFMGATFTPDDPEFNRFMKMVTNAGPATQMTIRVKTAARAELSSAGN